MTEDQAISRFVAAVESMAVSLATMAKQQGEFLATLPAEEVTVEPAPSEPHPFEPAAPTHAYDATCACQACWAERQRLKREKAA